MKRLLPFLVLSMAAVPALAHAPVTSPSLQFLIGVLVFKEAFDATRAIGFAAIWAGLVIFASDGLWRARRRDALVAASAGK